MRETWEDKMEKREVESRRKHTKRVLAERDRQQPPSQAAINAALQPLIDRIELLESITDQSCNCEGR